MKLTKQEKAAKYKISKKRLVKLMQKYGELSKVSDITRIPYFYLVYIFAKKIGKSVKEFKNELKTIRIKTRKKEYICKKKNLVRLWGKHGSLETISEITGIPYDRLHGLFKNRLHIEIPTKTNKNKYNYNMNELVRLFKKYGFLPPISKITGIPSGCLHHILVKEFGMGLFELRQKLGIRRSCLKRRDLEKNSSRYQQIKEAYERLGTLAKAGEEFHLTRERVRQILNQGEKRGVFIYELNREKRFREISQKYDRGSLIKEIRMLISPSRICMKLGIKISDFKKLLEYFTIDYKDYRLLAVMGKTAEKYSQIVDTLGHHPTTTEMNTKTEWRAIWGAIDRYWGNMGNFRKEYGIEKPKQKVHTNTLLAFKKLKEKRRLIKKEKLGKVAYLIKQEGPISATLIRNKLEFKSAMTWIYIRELLGENLISRIGKGNQVRYISNH